MSRDQAALKDQCAELTEEEKAVRQRHRIERLVLATFIFTFVTARILVIFIMAGKLPPGTFGAIQ